MLQTLYVSVRDDDLNYLWYLYRRELASLFRLLLLQSCHITRTHAKALSTLLHVANPRCQVLHREVHTVSLS